MTASPSQTLTDLRNTLLGLHKILLTSERAIYERDVEPVKGPGQMLALLMEDPWFAYLRDLSKLVVEIDELIDARDRTATHADALSFIRRAQMMLTPDEHGSGFERRYHEAIQRDPDVVIAHCKAAKVIQGLK